jgi:hypothetical protein
MKKIVKVVKVEITKLTYGYDSWFDENDNQFSFDRYTYEQAVKASRSLKNCELCYDCENCENCVECAECKNCVNCVNCTYCENCINCENCHCKYSYHL